MPPNELPTYFRLPWPEPDLPAGEPDWLYYEINHAEDAVSRFVETFPDGRIARNSIEIETRNGGQCPSLIDTSLREGFEGIRPEEISRERFEEFWRQGVDTPVWNIR